MSTEIQFFREIKNILQIAVEKLQSYCTPKIRANVYAYMYKTVFVSSIAFAVAGIVLTVFSLLSPTWQITKRPKTAEIHHHGLWWDCVVSDGTLIPLGREKSSQQSSEKCVSKFNPAVQSQLKAVLENGDAFSKELLSHRFLPHHKSVIFFSAFTLVFGAIGVITGACSPCFPPNSLLFVVSSFMTGACSLLSDVIFVLGTANTVTTVKEPSHLEGAGGENRVGMACYVHMFATTLFLLALISSIGLAYLLMTSDKGREGCCSTEKQLIQHHGWNYDERTVLGCSGKPCRPIVVIEDDIL